MLRMRKFFNTYIIIIFFFFGCFFAGNQLLVNYVGESFVASNVEFGYLVGATYVGSLTMVLVLGEVSGRIGKRLGAVIAALCYSIGALFVALAGNIKLSVVAFLIFGCGTGGIEAMLFSLIGDYNGPNTNKVMNISQAFFSVGAVLGPLIINWMVGFMSYKYIYGIMWAFMGILSLMFYLSRDIDTFAKKSPNKQSGLMLFKLVKNPVMVIFMLALMLAIGCESSLTFWITKYFDVLGVVALGSFALSAYWIASIPGRLISAAAKNQGRHLTFSFILGSVGIVLLLILPTPMLKFIGIIIVGIALAPVYPVISTLGASLYPDNSGPAFSLMVFSCGLGGALAQPVIGAISESSSISTVYGIISIILLVLAAMIHVGVKLSKKSG